MNFDSITTTATAALTVFGMKILGAIVERVDGRPIDELNGVCPCATLLLDDRRSVDGRREQEGRDGHRNGGNDARDQRLVDDAGAARHCRDEAKGVRAGVDGKCRVVDGRHTADLDACHGHGGKCPVALHGRTPARSSPEWDIGPSAVEDDVMDVAKYPHS